MPGSYHPGIMLMWGHKTVEAIMTRGDSEIKFNGTFLTQIPGKYKEQVSWGQNSPVKG